MKPFMQALQPWDLADIPKEALPRMCQDSRGIVARDLDTNELLAAAIMDTWSENSCMIHVFIGNPLVLRHNFAEEVFKYVFIDSGRNLIIGSTPSDNEKALKFNKHMGFVEQMRIKDGHSDGVDFVVTEMRKEDCRWIAKHLEQQRAA